ncbi:MAG: serine/threonine-protein kinase, partial [Micropruina sp.]
MAPGTLVDGRYRLDAEVGHGGMGRVWRAWDTRLDREVAVKTVDLSASTDPSTGPRFQREILATARLNVPSVVTIFDGGVDGHTAFLVMEYLNGHTVAQLVRDSGPLAVPRVLEIALPVATGLVAAHATGLVHRDIKPANVMITGNSVKLLDFGIAQLAQDIGAGMTATATTIGTADYMSPEQAAGQRVGPPTDLYALGCLITFMITGRAPFAGESAVAIATQQLNAIPPRLDERRAGVPGALTELVGRLLSKDPNARPDAAGTVAALAAIQAQPYAPLTLPLATVVQPAATAVLPAGMPQ